MSQDFDDERYAMTTRGSERKLQFVRPYRYLNELNPIERFKLDRHPFEVAEAIVNEYSSKGVSALMAVPGEVERLKWVGLYPQKQGGDAFMMRIKVPGGVLTAPQIREIGLATEAFGEGPDDHPYFGNRYGSGWRTSRGCGSASPRSASRPCRPVATALGTSPVAR